MDTECHFTVREIAQLLLVGIGAVSYGWCKEMQVSYFVIISPYYDPMLQQFIKQPQLYDII